MLKGAAHVHSTFSFDGKVEIGQLQSFFAARGFDFVLMSEHIEHLDLAKMQEIYDACGRVSDERCVLIPGIEIDDLHILIFGIHRPESFTGPLPLTEEAYRNNALIVVSHPVKIRRGVPDAVLPLIAGVEVWNSRYDGRIAPRPLSLALFHRLQKCAPALTPFCGMDFHSYSDFSGVSIEVDAEKRTPADILAAFRASHFRILHEGKPIPIYAGADAWQRALFTVRSRVASTFYDAITSGYRLLKRFGLFVPKRFRHTIKRWI